MKRLLIIPDTHIPYEDGRAFGLMLRAARKLKPDTIVILGDFADFYSVSAHDKDPTRALSLKDEATAVNKRLDQLDALGAKAKHFIEGNHEYRLARHLRQQAPALHGLLSVPSLFRLRERGWSYTPYMSSLRIGKVNFTHDCGDAGQLAHIRARQTFEGNAVIGHVHRLGVSYAGNAKGSSHVGAAFGWLGDVSEVDYMHKVKARQWHLGFGVGYLDGETIHLQAIPIIGYRAVVGGELIQ